MKIPQYRRFLNAALIAFAALFGLPSHGVDLAIPLTIGWNLLGNTGSPAIDVQADLGDSAKVTTVWKWNAQDSVWAFYAPALAASGNLASYASGKGYQVLSTIEPGEGFWVNAAQPFTLNRTGITPFTLGPTYTGASGLVTGWNLVATSDALSPAQIDTKLGGSAAAPSFVTMWAWSNADAAWYFYAPALAANGSLPGYIQSKGYLDFGALTDSTGLGFWLNSNINAIKVVALTVSVTGSGTVRSSTAGSPNTITSCSSAGGGACTGTYPVTTPVALTATAGVNSFFIGWSGGSGTCTGTASPCTLEAGSTSVTATFASVPGAPTIGTATRGNAQASVTFSAPASNGGATITSYRVTASPGGRTATGVASPIVVSSLANGTAYTFTVTATNIVGTGPASTASNSVTPATFPGAPTIGTATGGNAQATVTFTAPASDGGSAITGYSVVSNPGGIIATGTASPIVVSGLNNGTAYTFRVFAINTVGTSINSSNASNGVTPATTPGAPTIGTATRGNTQASITFSAPASNGGAAITGYTVTSSGGQTATGTTSPIVVSGLANGTAYTFTVTATNSVGTGAASAASNSVTPATTPDAPTIGTATGGNAKASVTFSAPASDGGAPITGYTVTSSPGGRTGTGTTSPIVVSGLTNGTAYTFTVRATNIVGAGAVSSASNSVTPAPTVPGAPTIGTATGRNQVAVVSFTAPADNGGAAITAYTVTSSPGGFTGTGTTSPIVVPGLTNGTAYTFTMTATNSVGTSAVSATSNSATPDVPPPYFLSPSGSDSNSGLSASAPWKTFAKAFSTMVAGDELVLLDGTYSVAAGTGYISYLGTNSAQPPSGSNLTAITYIHALNPGQVVIDGQLFIGRSTRKDSYIKIQGVTFEGGGKLYNADYTTIKDSGFHGAFSVGTPDHTQNNDHNLIEDVWIWASGERVIAINYRSHFNVWRRVVVRGDGCGTASCQGSGNPNVGISVYDSNNISLQNIIVVDRILDALGTPYADFATAQHTPAQPTYFLGQNEWLGTMSIKAPDQGYNFEADAIIPLTTSTDPTIKIQNAVAWDSANTGFNMGVGTNNLLENLTVKQTTNVSADGVRVAPAVTTGFVRNVVVAGATRYGMNSAVRPSNVDVFGAPTLYFQLACTTGCLTSNPQADTGPSLKYLPRIETGSTLAGAGIGANIIYRYGTDGTRFGEPGYNTLTDTSLWPWPNEARIKSEMCASTTRGFCSTGTRLDGVNNVTLTSYIWEYLGNQIPAGIYP